MSDNIRTIKTQEEIKIFTDPYRLEIISEYQKQDKPLTVKMVADLMGETPAKVHYHIKKLLAIDILTLDHVEVVNGINAKYYKLITDEFKLDLSDVNDSVEFEESVNKVESFIEKIVNDFKKELFKTSRNRKNCTEEENSIGGLISSPPIYLSKEDYLEVEETIKDISRRFSKRGEGKQEYATLLSVIKKIND